MYLLLLILTIAVYVSVDDFLGIEMLVARIVSMVIVAISAALVQNFSFESFYPPMISLAWASIT
jgi:hypothetical protein